MKVYFKTFGCRLNKAEALQMEADYLAQGWQIADQHADADLFIIRGCSVTERAQRECEDFIDHLQRHYPRVPIRICGCLRQDAVASNRGGGNPNERILLNRMARQGLLTQKAGADAPLPTRTARAYLKVQDGCSGKCSFCIVPQFRGDSVSVPFTKLIDRARQFIDAGYHEIVITGCNLALYASEGKRLPDLLSTLAELSSPEKPCRFRLGSLEPGVCALETIHAMAEHANICRFLHIPVQSGSPRVLIAMRRPYQVKDVDTLAKTAAKLMPSLGLGCDIMTGFPGETDLDFLLTQSLLERLPFNHAHIFPYSERPQTAAASLGGVVPRQIRSARAHQLADRMHGMRTRYAQSFVGKTVEVVSERSQSISGWTEQYLACEAIGRAPRKALVRVFVTGLSEDRLVGRIVTPN